MQTYEFIVALAREAGSPFAFAVASIAAAVALPIIVSGVRRAAARNTELLAQRDIKIKELETSVRNGAVALTRPKAVED